MKAPHIVSEPSIPYFGTPVVLISTQNEDGSANLAPMSSAFWLGWRCILGLNATSKTTVNMIRTGQCVLNLPSVDNVAAVNRLACLTGSNPVPAVKLARGYTHEKNKFETAGLTAIPSLTVAPPRALECPVQMEAVVAAKHDLMEDDDVAPGQDRHLRSPRDARSHSSGYLDGWLVRPGRPQQVAATDDELPAILRPRRGSS